MATPISNFLTDTIEVERRCSGSWVRGRFEGGELEKFSLSASVQPMKGNLVIQEPSARRTGDHVRVYTEQVLYATDEKNNIVADVITRRGIRYEILEVQDWTETDMPHYKSIAVKIDGQGGGVNRDA